MTEYKRIMIPVDFSENSPKLLQAGVDVAEKFQAELFIVFVVQSFEDYSGFFVPHMPIAQFEEEMLQSAEQKMDNFLHENLKTSLTCHRKVLKGDVAEELARYAAETKVAMIIMGTHGYKGLERVLFGSVAEKIVKTAPCPVLTINPYR
ncbi:MAG: universal stress protein [Proteobacteria bacterium]|nr:universal stress protein [Pseudomonadota bacterium]MBU1737265.1 universal stress protein [Pseudomonadota bacterium]